MIKHNIYEIKWRDHFSTEGFFDKQDIDIQEEMLFDSVGYFIKEDKNYYHIARSHGETDYADIMSIMKKNVIKIRELN
jgi:hypothetical protein